MAKKQARKVCEKSATGQLKPITTDKGEFFLRECHDVDTGGVSLEVYSEKRVSRKTLLTELPGESFDPDNGDSVARIKTLIDDCDDI